MSFGNITPNLDYILVYAKFYEMRVRGKCIFLIKTLFEICRKNSKYMIRCS